MQDFAGLLVHARERAGLTQSQLAEAANLTPSYLSFIENRKKPPPSDAVCRRLAKALRLPPQELLDLAHLERAPEPLRKKLNALTHSLSRERKSRLRVLRELLSPFLFGGPPGFSELAVDTLSVSPSRRKRIRQVLGAVGRHHTDKEKALSAAIEKLPERERTLLLEALPRLLGKTRPLGHEGRILSSPPPSDSAHRGPYLLETPSAAGAGEIRAGDRLLVDPDRSPAAGEWVVLRGEQDRPRLARVVAGSLPGQLRLIAEGGPEALPGAEGATEAELASGFAAESPPAWLRRALAGVVLEVRRRMTASPQSGNEGTMEAGAPEEPPRARAPREKEPTR